MFCAHLFVCVQFIKQNENGEYKIYISISIKINSNTARADAKEKINTVQCVKESDRKSGGNEYKRKRESALKQRTRRVEKIWKKNDKTDTWTKMNNILPENIENWWLTFGGCW